MATLLGTILKRARDRLNEPYIAAPGAPTVALAGAGAGNVENGVHLYEVTFVTAYGETTGGTSATVTVADKTVNGKVALTAIPVAVSSQVTARKIYRTVAAGTAYLLLTTLSDNTTTTYTDNTADASLGAAIPTYSTALTGAEFWGDPELLDIALEGCKDLWRAFANKFGEDYFLTIDATNVSMAASTLTLTGVPSDVGVVKFIEVRDLTTSSSNRDLFFRPLDYHHPSFRDARGMDAISGNVDVIYYHVRGAGAPVGTPTIDVAPKVTAAINLTLGYIPTLGTLTAASNNPIPGETDLALEAFIVAFARAKESEDRAPDLGWLTTYKTEKTSALNATSPRQVDQPYVAEGLFEGMY